MGLIKDIIPFREDITLKYELNFVNLLITILALGLIGFYLYGVLNFLLHGHHSYNVTRTHPWGFLVASYEFFVAIAMGSVVIGASAIFFEIDILKPLIKRLLIFGLLSLFAGFTAFLFEIGHPIRMIIYTALSGNPHSALFWLGVFYPLFMLFTILTFIAYVKESNSSKIFAMFAIIFANSAVLTAGSIFGNLNSRLFSSGIFYQIEFMATAILGGIFLLTLITVIFKREDFEEAVIALKRVSIAVISLLVIMYLVKYISGVYGGVPERADSINYIFKSSNFLIFELGLGLIFPLLVAVFGAKDKIGLFCLASLFGLIGIMFSRINLVEGIQLAPMQPMNTRVYQESVTLLTSYSPSITELAIGVGAIGVFIFFIFLAEKIINLEEE